jgi:hypothetical protein
MKKQIIKNPLPHDAFDENEPVEGEDFNDDPLSELEDGVEVDEDGDIISETYSPMLYCDWFGCVVRNPKVCTWCGIYFAYFSKKEH